jgi:hypothetical protein
VTRPARGGRLPSYPRVCPCRHCGLVVLRDNDGNWIHASLSYTCRDRWGGVAGTTAEPAAPGPARAPRSGYSGPESGALAWGDGSDRL